MWQAWEILWILCNLSCYHDLAQASWCSLRVLEVRSIHEALHQGLAKVLVRRCCEDPDESSKGSLHDLLQVLVWRSWRGPGEILSKRSLHDPVQVLYRRSCGDPSEILSTRSLHEDLADAMSHRCLYESSCGRLQQLQVLLSRSCEILLGVLAWRSWSRSFAISCE